MTKKIIISFLAIVLLLSLATYDRMNGVVQKITFEIKTKTIFGLLPGETLSLSSIGESETWNIEKGFNYGTVSGNTHSLSVLKSYFLTGIELHVQTESINGIDGLVVEVPIR